MKRLLVLVAAVLGASLVSRVSHALPTSQLTYVRAGGTEEACPDEAELRHAVARRVGYDPFFPWAERVVVAQIERAPRRGFVGQVRIIDRQGHLLGERTLDPQADCAELVQNVALAISIAIDDLDTARPSTTPSEPTPSSPPPSASVPDAPRAEDEAPVPPPRPPPPERALHGRASLGLAGSLGSAPAPSAGALLGVAGRVSWLQVGVEGRVDFPAGTTVSSGGRVSSWLIAASIVPCGVLSLDGSVAPYACALATYGRYEARSEGVAVPGTASARYAALGGRVGLDVTLGRWLAVYGELDLTATLTRHRLELDDNDVFTLPAANVGVSGGLVARF